MTSFFPKKVCSLGYFQGKHSKKLLSLIYFQKTREKNIHTFLSKKNLQSLFSPNEVSTSWSICYRSVSLFLGRLGLKYGNTHFCREAISSVNGH